MSGSFIKGQINFSQIKLGNNNNNIIVISNSICLDTVNINIQSVPYVQILPSDQLNINDFNNKISTISNLLQNRDMYGNPLVQSLPTGKLNNTVTLYYPLLTEDTYDPVFAVNISNNMTTITSNTFSDLMTPFGRALIMIFPKT